MAGCCGARHPAALAATSIVIRDCYRCRAPTSYGPCVLGGPTWPPRLAAHGARSGATPPRGSPCRRGRTRVYGARRAAMQRATASARVWCQAGKDGAGGGGKVLASPTAAGRALARDVRRLRRTRNVFLIWACSNDQGSRPRGAPASEARAVQLPQRCRGTVQLWASRACDLKGVSSNIQQHQPSPRRHTRSEQQPIRVVERPSSLERRDRPSAAAMSAKGWRVVAETVGSVAQEFDRGGRAAGAETRDVAVAWMRGSRRTRTGTRARSRRAGRPHPRARADARPRR
jgi:hypothetical protein